MDASLSLSRLKRVAEIYTTHLIDSVEEVPAQGWLFGTEAQNDLDRLSSKQLVISEQKVIYTCCHDWTVLHRAKKRMAEYFDDADDSGIRIQPCTEHVIEQIFRAEQEYLTLTQPTNNNVLSEVEVVYERSPAQKFMDMLVDHAARMEATDIHINVYESRQQALIQYRVFGLLQTVADYVNNRESWSFVEVESACAAVINADAASTNGTTKGFTTRELIDASFISDTSVGKKKVRYAQTPTVDGFKVVLRVLPLGAVVDRHALSIKQLGYRQQHADLLEEVGKSSSGLIVVAGPTGSGKTTTLNLLMEQIPSYKAVYSYEEPVEYELSRAVQVPVNSASEHLNWQSLSKNSLRMDPDVIMYGELREASVAKEVINAATTGHLVLTTLHANSAMGCVTRLHDLGVPYGRLAESGLIKSLVFQKLMPSVCQYCCLDIQNFKPQTEYQRLQFERLQRMFDGMEGIKIANTQLHECHHCRGAGIAGRILVAEVLEVNEADCNFIASGDLKGWQTYLDEMGWYSIKAHAASHVLAGSLCPMLVEHALSGRLLKLDIDQAQGLMDTGDRDGSEVQFATH